MTDHSHTWLVSRSGPGFADDSLAAATPTGTSTPPLPSRWPEPRRRNQRGRPLSHGVAASRRRFVLLISVTTAALLFFGTAPALAAATYVVSTLGSDTNPGTLQHPWRTIQHAADSTTPGDTVLVRKGVYAPFTVLTSGRPAAPITYKNYPGEVPAISGGDPNVMLSADYQPLGWIVIDGFDLRNAVSDGVKAYNIHDSIIRHCDIHHNGDQNILIVGAKNLTLDSNRIHDAAPRSPQSTLSHGVYLTGNDVRIVNNLIYANRAYGLQIQGYVSEGGMLPAYGGARRIVVANNTFASSVNRSGIVTYWGDDPSTGVVRDVTIANNIFYKNSEAPLGTDSPNGIELYFGTNITIASNLYYGSRRFFLDSSGGLVSNVTQRRSVARDPRFVNPRTGDYHLTAASPAIDSADATYAPRSDFDGVPRPQAAGYDRGAFEFRVRARAPTCVVPHLLRLGLRAAKDALRRAGCSIGRIYHQKSTRITRGRVVASSPASGRRLPYRSRINLTISVGR